jgi:molybdopterin adenylyltransferase
MVAKIGVLNISDRASAGVYADTPGQACVALLREWLVTPFELDYQIVPDERAVLERELTRMADTSGCGLIITTGGTGPAPRDVTPEATAAVCEKNAPGLRGADARHLAPLRADRDPLAPDRRHPRPHADRQPARAGPRPSAKTWRPFSPAIPYCLDLIGGPRLETKESVMKAFRPKA